MNANAVALSFVVAVGVLAPGPLCAGGSPPYEVAEGQKVDAATLGGWRTWRALACERCHGAQQEGLVGPSLVDSLRRLSKEEFEQVVLNGRPEKGMPNFSASKMVNDNLGGLYSYLKGRSDGAIQAGNLQPIADEPLQALDDNQGRQIAAQSRRQPFGDRRIRCMIRLRIRGEGVMRIAIVGAGAIGIWLGVRLAKVGCEISLLARDRTLAAIRQRGMQLVIGGETQTAAAKASDNAADLGVQDLVIVAVKGQALAAVAPAVATLSNASTTVLTAMNGVPWWFFHGSTGPLRDASLETIDPGSLVKQAIPPARVLGCVVHAACSTGEPGCAIHKTGNGLIVGEPNGESSTRLDSVSGVLRQAGFDVTVSRNIQRDIWFKLWGNMTLNPISALTGATTDRMLDDPLVAAFVLRVMAEASELGAHIGCAIAESGTERMQVTRKLGSFKTSMLQDVEAGRTLELDALLAAPREIGRKLGIATPNMDALHGLTRLFAQVRGLNPQ